MENPEQKEKRNHNLVLGLTSKIINVLILVILAFTASLSKIREDLRI